MIRVDLRPLWFVHPESCRRVSQPFLGLAADRVGATQLLARCDCRGWVVRL